MCFFIFVSDMTESVEIMKITQARLEFAYWCLLRKNVCLWIISHWYKSLNGYEVMRLWFTHNASLVHHNIISASQMCFNKVN